MQYVAVSGRGKQVIRRKARQPVEAPEELVCAVSAFLYGDFKRDETFAKEYLQQF